MKMIPHHPFPFLPSPFQNTQPSPPPSPRSQLPEKTSSRSVARAPILINANDTLTLFLAVRAEGVLGGVAVPLADDAVAADVNAVGAGAFGQGVGLSFSQILDLSMRESERRGNWEIGDIGGWGW